MKVKTSDRKGIMKRWINRKILIKCPRRGVELQTRNFFRSWIINFEDVALFSGIFSQRIFMYRYYNVTIKRIFYHWYSILKRDYWNSISLEMRLVLDVAAHPEAHLSRYVLDDNEFD